MKKFRRIMALLLATAMVLSMGLTAFAAGEGEGGNTPAATHKLTITHQDGKTDAVDHVYKAYQILTGDLTGTEGSYVLANMKWGANAPTGKTAGQKLTDAEVTEVKAWTAETVKSLNPTGTTEYVAVKNAAGDYEFAALPNGYYVVKDETTLSSQYDANSAIIVQVVGDTTVQTKRAFPTVDKQVYDDEEAAWSDAADHDLYESFQFKLIATIAADADYAAYPTYKVVFNDTMSVGVAFESIASVKVGNTTLDSEKYDYTATPEANNGDAESKWTLTIDDLKTAVPGLDLTRGTTVEVIYNAHLTNKVATFYKDSDANATPTNNKVYLEYSNKPGAEGTGKTEEDTVWVFSYEIDNKKVDASNNNAPLSGAGFKLYLGTTEVGLIYDASINAYRPIKTGETAEEMTSADSTGIFNIKGVDPGKYTLKETTTPPGYTTMEDKTIEIEATTVENQDGASANLTMTKKDTNNTIENKKGATLPSTGGIGTTMFYIIGAIMVICAGVVLISRRRMNVQ